jgi:hypothetical protein
MTAACGQTIQSIGFSEDVTWNRFGTGFLSPYDELSVVTIGDDITAGLGSLGVWYHCEKPDSSQYITPSSCPSTENSLGTLSWYVLEVALNRPSFRAGGVQLVSDSAGTVQAISIAVNSNTDKVELNAGTSQGTIPAGLEADFDTYSLHNTGYVEFFPHDPEFDSATAAGFECLADGEIGGDGILFKTDVATGSYSAQCGAKEVTYNLRLPYDSVGECIAQSIGDNCKHQGLTGRDRAACNSAQIGNCHAAFHVPSAHSL